MNLLKHGKTDRPAYLEIFSYTAFLLLIFLAYDSGNYWLLIIPYLIIATLFIIYFPNLLFYTFIASFFFQKALISKGLISIFAVDPIIILIMMGYFSSYYKSKEYFNSADYFGPIFKPMSLLFLLSIVSFFINVSSYKTETTLVSFWYIYRFLQLLLCFYIFSDNRLKIDFFQIIKVVLFLAFLQLPIALFQYSGYSGFDLQYTRGLVTGTLTSHHGMLGTFMMIPLALSLGALWENTDKSNKIKYLVLSLLLFIVIILSSARSAILGLGIAVVIYAVLKFRFNLKYFLSLFAGAVVSLLIIFLTPLKDLIFLTFNNSFNPVLSLDFATVYRFFIWKATTINFLSTDLMHKLFGTGIGAFNTISFPFVIEDGNKYASGAHNLFLHVLSEIGLIGLVLFLLLFFNILKVLYRYSKYSSYAKAYFFITIAMLASSLTQETFWFQKSFGSLWLFYTLILSIILKHCFEDIDKKPITSKGKYQ